MTTGRSTRPRADVIDDELDCLGRKFETVLWVTADPDDRMVDQLTGRHQLIDELESSLLPSITDLIDSIFFSLDLKDSSKHSSPDIELAFELATDLNNTLEKTIDHVEGICAMFEDGDEDDGSFKRCKEFRRSRLQVKIGDWMNVQIVNLFCTYGRYIKYCNRTRRDPENPELQAKKAKWREKTIRISDICRRFTIETIRWSKKSDLAILQEGWLAIEELSICALESLTKYTKPCIINLGDAPYSSHSETDGTAEYFVKLARLCIPIVKLTSIFMNKLTKQNAAESLFTLDPEIDSKNLELLSLSPDIITDLQCLTLFFRRRPERDRHLDEKDDADGCVRRLSQNLESILLVLAFYHIPTPATVDCPSLKNQMRIWFLDWKNLWRMATDRFLDLRLHPPPNIPFG
ncbi:hypothetical protein Pst134EA_006998 [Puccinia striiformis f. sp. tritici]|uniref:Uncharacterized protein n=1 Tax=Puccinia striiformis f. sp. tritici PST-78 TaxID=1165861 RepID=A0A0L0VYQ0_9BASI|nr:hypothetical protein Pst134EA_006998 [Puccinia striiformis f. sp. tritici]KAH9469717.1 hypothetical protein Pst134EA_006998 [Puccinia striiformis f. sp. tritici]KNF04327.1 hypothetical protein PSTG_02669 [Puccinia striiformis f. sp. tritici PST-78]